MTITIREALQLPDMVQTRLVAGKSGLDNQIRWVTIVEILEDTTRLQEGEFLITTGFGLADDEARQAGFIPSLVKQRLSGVAIHTGFYLREIPRSFIETADRHGLPLIEIPVELNFSTVTKAILQPIINRQFETLAYSQAIHEQIIRVALTGGGLAAIADELARLSRGRVSIADAYGYELVASGGTCLDPQTATPAASARPLSRTVPIQATRETYGRLTLTKPADQWKELDQIALQHAATLCALEFVKERAVAETKWRMQGDFVEEILSGRLAWSAETEARSRMLGYPLSGSHFVAAIRADAPADPVDLAQRHSQAANLLKRLANRANRPYLLRERPHHLLLILPEGKESVVLLEQLSQRWHKLTPECPLRIALSEPRQPFTALPEAAHEAVFALTAYPLLAEPPSLLRYREMAGYQVLYPLHRQPDALRQLWQPWLERLIAHDEKHGQHLMETLTVYLRENLNGLQAAKALYIHRHTLKYRLQQIEEKTGCRLSDASHRWQLQLALMAYRLHRLLYP